MKNKYIRVSIEAFVWICFIILPLILFPTLQPFVDEGTINQPLLGMALTHSLLIVFYYFNYYYALPRFYFTRKYKIYFPLVAGCLFGLILIMLSDKDFNPLPSPPFRYATTAYVISIALRFLMMLLLSLGFSSYSKLKLAEKEKLKTELSYLKSQINPHFLFNTLNSIYALTVKKSDAAPESVTRLASIMRYAITEASADHVPLEKEIKYISAYIDLEKLRLTDKVNLKYELKGDFNQVLIAPMLFLPLIENTFKHGVSTHEHTDVHIKIAYDKGLLTLSCSNTKLKPIKSDSGGLGLQNVKKRLQLLYSGKYDLKITEDKKYFLVNLTIILND